MPADFTLDQAGLPAGTLNTAREDGLDTGAQITITTQDPGIVQLVDVPVGEGNVTPAVTGNPLIWTYTPTPGVYGTYLFRNTVGAETKQYAFVVRTPNQSFTIPAWNEVSDTSGLIQTAGATQIEESNNNVGGNVRGWAKALSDLVNYVDGLVSGGATLQTAYTAGSDITLDASENGIDVTATLNTTPAFSIDTTSNASTQVSIALDNAGAIESDRDIFTFSQLGTSYAKIVNRDGGADWAVVGDSNAIDDEGTSITLQAGDSSIDTAGNVNLSGGNLFGDLSAQGSYGILFGASGTQGGDVLFSAGSADVAGGNAGTIALQGASSYSAGIASNIVLQTGNAQSVAGTAGDLYLILGRADTSGVAGHVRIVGDTGTLENPELRLYELPSAGGNYTGFTSPLSLASNIVYTLPSTAPNDGDFLNSASGTTLQWVPSSSLVSLQSAYDGGNTIAVAADGAESIQITSADNPNSAFQINVADNATTRTAIELHGGSGVTTDSLMKLYAGTGFNGAGTEMGYLGYSTAGIAAMLLAGANDAPGDTVGMSVALLGGQTNTGNGGLVLLIGGPASGLGTGGDINILGGDAITPGATTGQATLGGGTDSSGSPGGFIVCTGGVSGEVQLNTSTSTDAGDIDITTGSATGAGNQGGSVVVTTGNSSVDSAGGDFTATLGSGGGTARGGDFVVTAGSTGSTGTGGTVSLTAGASTAGTAGPVNVTGGGGGTTGTGGLVAIAGGAGGASSGTGGAVTVTGGLGATFGGAVTVTAGAATNGDAGITYIVGGASTGLSGEGGDVRIDGGQGTTQGGAVEVTGGTSEEFGGPIVIESGAATVNGDSGSITLRVGLAAGGGDPGNIRLLGRDAPATSAVAGSDITGTAGDGDSEATGGNVTFTSGTGGATGDGGNVTLTAGNGGSTSGDGGRIIFNTGTVTSGNEGYVDFNDNNAGEVRTITFGATPHTDAAPGATPTIDWAVNGQMQEITLSANITSITFTTPIGIGNFTLVVKQPGAGGPYTVTGWPAAVLWPGNVEPFFPQVASIETVINFYYDGTNWFGHYQDPTIIVEGRNGQTNGASWIDMGASFYVPSQCDVLATESRAFFGTPTADSTIQLRIVDEAVTTEYGLFPSSVNAAPAEILLASDIGLPSAGWYRLQARRQSGTAAGLITGIHLRILPE